MKAIKVVSLVLAVVFCFGAFVACAGSNYTKDNETFVIGATGPLTGGAAVYGIGVKNAAQMAVDEINAAGGLDGVMFELRMLDDQHKADKVPSLYQELLEGGMQVSLGTVTTNPALEFKPLAKEDNVFFITPSASADAIPAGDANAYQMCFADTKQGVAAGEFVKENYKGQTIGVFYKSDDAYSKGIYEEFVKTVGSAVTLTVQSFDDSNATEFGAQVDALKNCKFIFMPTYYDPASIFMTAAKNVMSADTVYYGCDGFDGIDAIDGFDINSIPQMVTMLTHYDSNADASTAAGTFAAKYTAKYGKETLNQFGASAYDCVYAIYNAMKAAKDAGEEIDVKISASDLSDILQAQFQGGFTYTGVTGTNMTWDADGYVKKNATYVVIKGFSA